MLCKAKMTVAFAALCSTLFIGSLIGTAVIGNVHAASPAADGLVSVKSSHDVATTIEKLQAVVESKGMKVFGAVDHQAGAASVDIELRPTRVLIFGNPKVGTPLMKCSQSIAIDLPQKALVWEDESGQVWLSYNDPEYLKARHSTSGCDQVFEKVTGALAAFSAAATAP